MQNHWHYRLGRQDNDHYTVVGEMAKKHIHERLRFYRRQYWRPAHQIIVDDMTVNNLAVLELSSFQLDK